MNPNSDAELGGAGHQHFRRDSVVWNLRKEGSNHRNVINVLADLWEDFRNLNARLSCFCELKRRAESLAFVARDFLPVCLRQFGFWIPSVHCRRCAARKNLDDCFGLRLEMWLPRSERTGGVCTGHVEWIDAVHRREAKTTHAQSVSD